jgi:5-methylcytosine-specific restriction endonuclease McrA
MSQSTQGGGRGRSSKRWRRLVANLRSQHRPCWLCGQPIDYTLKPPDPSAFQVDHIKPRSHYPELAEEPTNLAPAHARCNNSKGSRAPKPTVGNTSRRW